MTKGRLEAFSDGVLAIIITIMVLELKVPHGVELAALKPILPIFVSYVLSFVYVAVYWNNHHHMLHSATQVDGRILWANTHLLFWLSLIPFVTSWMGENHFAMYPVIFYGIVLCMSGVAYYILALSLIRLHGERSTLAIAIGKDRKGKISILLCALGIICSFLHPFIGLAAYTVVLLIWLIPDKRIEKEIRTEHEENKK